MKGWSAPEGEVGVLLHDLQVMRGFLATREFDANAAALMLDYHLREFERVEEPS